MKPSHFLATVAALAAGTSEAAVLRFDSFSTVGAATYGDRITTFTSDIGSDGGATPNLVLDFVTLSGTAFTVYSSGYGTLNSALGHTAYDQPGYVQITPDAGFDVVLTRFDLAGWASNNYPNSRVQVVDTSGNSLFDTGTFTFTPSVVQSYPPAPIRSSLPVRIVINDFGDLGLDNLTFGQAASIPEASTAALAAAALAGCWRRRRPARA